MSFAGFTVPRLSPLNSLPTLFTTFSPIFFTLATAFFDDFISSGVLVIAYESSVAAACLSGESDCDLLD